MAPRRVIIQHQVMVADTYTANVEIRNLPLEANRVINALSKLTGKTKATLIREALVEYANNHRGDIVRLAGPDRAKGKI